MDLRKRPLLSELLNAGKHSSTYLQPSPSGVTDHCPAFPGITVLFRLIRAVLLNKKKRNYEYRNPREDITTINPSPVAGTVLAGTIYHFGSVSLLFTDC